MVLDWDPKSSFSRSSGLQFHTCAEVWFVVHFRVFLVRRAPQIEVTLHQFVPRRPLLTRFPNTPTIAPERLRTHDRTNYLALPHRREDRRRRHGCGLQG